MSATNSPMTFAYGVNQLSNNCQCPAMAAGIEPGIDNDYPHIRNAAERYDHIVTNGKDSFEGEISEEEAKDAWIQMMEDFEKKSHPALPAAEEVAEHHGWI